VGDFFAWESGREIKGIGVGVGFEQGNPTIDPPSLICRRIFYCHRRVQRKFNYEGN